jgi:hypothetical protein
MSNDDDAAGDVSSQDDEASESADDEDKADDSNGDDDASSSDIDPWQKMIGTTCENMQNHFDRRVASYVENGGIAFGKAERVAAAEMRPNYEWMLREVYEQRLLFNRAL